MLMTHGARMQRLPTNLPALPGPMNGFGGGTFNMYGSQATPVDNAGARPGPPGRGTILGNILNADADASGPPFPMGSLGGGDSPATGQDPMAQSPSSSPRTDYGALLQQMLGPRPEMSGWQKAAAIIGPALMAATGDTASAARMTENIGANRREYDQQARELGMTAVKWRREDDQAEAKRNEPQFFSGSEDRVRYDPGTGAAERVYDAPQEFDDYAAAQGLEPGSDDYFSAVEDYVLRGSGPTAFQYDKDLEAVRQAGRIASEAGRQRNREALESVRQGNRLQVRATAPARAAGATSAPVKVKTPGDAQKLKLGTLYQTPDGQVLRR
jgi:hypothetical protein